MVWAFDSYAGDFSGIRLLFFFSLLLVGVLMMFLMRILFTLPVFWTQSERGMANLLDGLVILSERPHKIFGGWFGRVLTTTLPFALYASLPCLFLFADDFDIPLLIHTYVVAALYFFVVWLIWHRGLRSYSSASS